MVNVEVQLHTLQIGRGTAMPMVTAAVAQCLTQALNKADSVMLEPVMDMEVIYIMFKGLIY